MVRKNKAVIITSSSTYESRVNAIEEFLFSKGYNILVLEPEFDHHLKKKRYYKKKNHRYIPMLAYQKNLSLKRVYSLYEYAKRVSQIAIDEEPEVLYVLLPANSLAKFTSEVKKKV